MIKQNFLSTIFFIHVLFQFQETSLLIFLMLSSNFKKSPRGSQTWKSCLKLAVCTLFSPDIVDGCIENDVKLQEINKLIIDLIPASCTCSPWPWLIWMYFLKSQQFNTQGFGKEVKRQWSNWLDRNKVKFLLLIS